MRVVSSSSGDPSEQVGHACIHTCVRTVFVVIPQGVVIGIRKRIPLATAGITMTHVPSSHFTFLHEYFVGRELGLR